jgi:branched-chain amino acid transport system permease protein
LASDVKASAAFRSPALRSRLLGFFGLLGALLLGNFWVERPLLDQSMISFYGMDQYKEGIIISCGLYVILAVALNIVNGFTGQFSLGHIGFYAVGAYVAAAVSTYGHNRLFPSLPIDGSPIGIVQGAYPVLLLCLIGGLAAATVGFIVGLPSLRLRGDYLAIITLGFAQIIQVVIRNIKAVDGATSFTGITRGDTTILTPHLTNFFWVFLFAALTLWVAYGLRFSTHGLAFLAVREDEIAAEAMGIPTTRYKVIAFVLSAFFTGIAGALFALYQPSLSNDQFSFVRSIDTVVMVVLGGLGSISGVAIAAVLLTVLPEALRGIDQYRLVAYSLLLIVLMLTRPQGIFGREELSRAWLMGQFTAIRGWFTRRPASPPVLATGRDVMTTARDRDDAEV